MAVRHRRALIALTAALALAGGGFAIVKDSPAGETPAGGTPVGEAPRQLTAAGREPVPATSPVPVPRATRAAAADDARAEVRRNASAVKAAPQEKYRVVDTVVDPDGDRSWVATS
jgi:hypothetical protein